MPGSLAIVLISLWLLASTASFAQAPSRETAAGVDNAPTPAASSATTQQTSTSSTESEISTYDTDAALRFA
jgi:hypothetical protein